MTLQEKFEKQNPEAIGGKVDTYYLFYANWLETQYEQLQFQLRDNTNEVINLEPLSEKHNSVKSSKTNSVEKAAQEVFSEFINRIHPNPEKIFEVFHVNGKGHIWQEIAALAKDYSTSQMKKKVEGIKGKEIHDYIEQYVYTDGRVRKAEAIESVLHFLTQLTK